MFDNLCSRFLQLKISNFVAIDGNRGAQQEFSVSIKVSKKWYIAFQQARDRTSNLGV